MLPKAAPVVVFAAREAVVDVNVIVNVNVNVNVNVDVNTGVWAWPGHRPGPDALTP